jgi:hypothetical protein
MTALIINDPPSLNQAVRTEYKLPALCKQFL